MIAEARKDRRSFACRDDNGFTCFSRAYFKESLPKAVSFEDAFQRVEILIRERELRRASIVAFSGSNSDLDLPCNRGGSQALVDRVAREQTTLGPQTSEVTAWKIALIR
jgi:hypothetical protein